MEEVADNLIRCVEDQQQHQIPVTYNNLKIAIVDAVQTSALVATAELKKPSKFVCALPFARGLEHDLVVSSTKSINCGNIS